MIEFISNKERARFYIATIALVVSLFVDPAMIGQLVRVLLLSASLLFAWNSFGDWFIRFWKGEVSGPTAHASEPTAGDVPTKGSLHVLHETRGSDSAE